MQVKLKTIFIVLLTLAAFLAGRFGRRNDALKESPSFSWPNDPVCGHTVGPLDYEPKTFFDDLESLIGEEAYPDAAGMLVRAYVDELNRARLN